MGIAAVTPNAKPVTGTKAEVEETTWALGPGSVTWRVMKDPTVFIIGLLREAMLLSLHPAFAAAAVDHDSFNDDPIMRFKHIAWYTYGATYGTPDDAEFVSDIVRRRHNTIVGMEPLTQLPYQANAEYELVLTQVMLQASFLAAYELLYGELTSAQRDQFCREQKVPAALLGVNPDHLPDTYGGVIDFIAQARNRFATGLQAREVLSPFATGEYPRGTAIGDLPPGVRQAAMFVLRSFSDMAMLTMSWEERELISINRRPKLGSRRATAAAMRLLSKWFTGEKGQAFFEKFLGERFAAIYVRGLAAENAPGGRTRVAQFEVPDAAPCFYHHADLLSNWPGSTADYYLGVERQLNQDTSASASAPVLLSAPVSASS
ncbi:oxygenase MpaB family protein [Mycobacterium sp. CVI_P3]|uniref:Oxygenase MpaB family protein n=1 Tax=Mycobacterium pinniadriaticum TaxID=2994102 RepID=A0ABT3SC48_9MYCO|nr:oxygenase MpaB family protein [Mycobacterium pinniadriaticum]MCX2930673.1 oxygenase MpaB family protein [Mycobacterium pinniadriaticum]MCX2937097.1 oxygenase MpaB family protein [Mycobacterium pinniadriaticum]